MRRHLRLVFSLGVIGGLWCCGVDARFMLRHKTVANIIIQQDTI